MEFYEAVAKRRTVREFASAVVSEEKNTNCHSKELQRRMRETLGYESALRIY